MTALISPVIEAREATPAQRAWRRLLRRRGVMLGLFIVLFLSSDVLSQIFSFILSIALPVFSFIVSELSNFSILSFRYVFAISITFSYLDIAALYKATSPFSLAKSDKTRPQLL